MHDAPEYLRQISLDFPGAEPQHANATRFQKFCARSVMRSLRGISVNATIHLNFELMLDTKGVEDKWAIWMLPTEL